MLIDIRAQEIIDWQKSAHELAKNLSRIETNARKNDKILLALHKVSLILIEKPDDWQQQMEKILLKTLAVSYCRLQKIEQECMSTSIKTKINRISIGGEPMEQAIDESLSWKMAKSYFYLPIKRQHQTMALLILAANKKDAFPSNAARDFTRRLAELIAVAL